MRTAIIINNEAFGKGDDELGIKLMGAFLRKLWANPTKPETIIFYNSGVKMMAKDSNVLEVLHGLYDQGVDLVACGTCIEHYGLRDKVEVGRCSDMVEIVATMMDYDKVITV